MDEPATGSVAFILSSTRSGSTWLALMLGGNSRSAYAGELRRMFTSSPETCALCSERGAVCPVFYGIDRVKPRDVHSLLLRRTGKAVLVDNSKTLSWTRKQLIAGGFAKKYIHLLRDPRAIVYAWRSRGRAKGLERWIDENYAIRTFLETNRLDYSVVTYNELADETDATLSELCAWLGLTYEPAQKEYWRFEHHGAGRNGATAAFLADYVTPDEAFYAARRRTAFHDLRWREAMSPEDQRAIEGDARVVRLLEEFGLVQTDTGLVRAPARVS